MLVQQPDLGEIAESELRTVTKPRAFPGRNAKHALRLESLPNVVPTPSSSLATARTLGVGAGQMSRVDSVKLAVMKAQSPLQAPSSPQTLSSPFPTA